MKQIEAQDKADEAYTRVSYVCLCQLLSRQLVRERMEARELVQM